MALPFQVISHTHYQVLKRALVHCYVMKRQRRAIAYAEDASECFMHRMHQRLHLCIRK